jgi:peptidoglycan hydrolase-like protein with peptidoglycan-binding domain
LAYIKEVRLRGIVALTAFGAAFSFVAGAEAASQHLGQRVLREGMVGHDVRVLQQYLGFSGFPTAIDGNFGPLTEAHVLAFERRFHLSLNGIVSAQFVAKIRAIVADRLGTAAVSDSTSGGVSFAPAAPQPGPTPTGPAGTTGPTGTPTGGGGTNPTGTTPSGTAQPTPLPPGSQAQLINGVAVAPQNAPQVVQNVIAAANQIATKPYIYGGGHGTWNDAGYDCSGSTSYALHGGGLLNVTMDSTEFESYGAPGPGQWITLWANGGHVYMEIAGLWFDTAAQSSSNGNDRWSTTRVDQASGYVERHPTGY